MRIKIIDIGNSKGIRLSKTILSKYQMTDYMDIKLEEDHIELIPISAPRQGWDLAFKSMHENGDDNLIIPDIFDDETFD